jgi:murein DD-endopeptidase MepM/ murein hydrolase activator NlpD
VNAPQPDPHIVSHFLAKQIVKSAKKGAPAVEDLAKAISEIELETQILGASFIKVMVIDPEWDLLTSGWLDVTDGLVDQIEVEFPEKSGWFWRLCAIDVTTDRTTANITLTFEDRIVAYMREYWHPPKTAPPGTTTRAQFVRDLVREIRHQGKAPRIRFVCPAVNKVQPVEQGSEEKTEGLKTAAAKDASEAKANKAPGLNAGSPATVKGQKLNAHQVVEANTLSSTADGLNAPLVAKEALMFAAIAESSLGAAAEAFTPNANGYYGVLQGNSQTWPDPHDTKGMATSFLLGGKGFQAGGAIALAKTISDPVEIAVRVEAPSEWPTNAYASEEHYSDFLPEARQIVHAGGGAGETAGESASDVGQLTRGTTENPDEDSWECASRLAAQVNWFLFTNGNTLFYMNGPQMVKQRPVLHVNVPDNKITKANGKREEGVIETPLTATYDSTTFQFRQTHKVKGKVQRKSRASKPSTPAEVRLPLVCGLEEYRAGDVIEFQKSGPINGRWIVSNATRNCLKDIFTTLILQPPLEPLPEPKGTPGGEAIAAAAGGASAAGYVNPFLKVTNLTPERIDMGVDFSGTGTIVALGDATVFEAVNTSGWEGGAFLGLTLTSGPYAGKSYYHAEQLTVLVKAGDTVKAGQAIATLQGGSESGWATGQPQQALAAALGQQGIGDPGSVESLAGASFNRLLVATGCPSGTKNPGGLSKNGQPMPSGYP